MAVKRAPRRQARTAGRRPAPAAGGLRETLVEAASALIARKGPQGFSLREVARRARVSEAAPYWHFADREALLAAVAERGFLQLAASMTEIWTATPDPLRRLQALGLGYVRFALVHPSYLRVMFGPEVPDKAAHPTLKQAADRTFEMLVQAVADAQAAGTVQAGDARVLAVTAWSLVHGLAALLVDGKLTDHARSVEEAEALAHQVTMALMLGLAPR